MPERGIGMNKQVKVVIGANFGDEGKGLMADYFCSKLSKNGSVLNIRFNGGAQAGHTVVVPAYGKPKRHVFSHFGAGSFVRNTDTYLSGDFILNPMLFCKEFDKLRREWWLQPKVYINHNCKITTPYDMLVNQIVERARGDQKHGSCGIGINETVLRYRNHGVGYIITPGCVGSVDLKHSLQMQRDYYLPKRLKDLGVSSVSLADLNVILSENVIDNWILQVNEMMRYCTVTDDNIVHEYGGIVFEGAQGLLLDEFYEEFAPHLTTSRTGFSGVNKILYNSGLSKSADLEVCFVTRTYFTRHGAGLFPTECTSEELFGEERSDDTNVWNEFQGSFRYGRFEERRFHEAVGNELKKVSKMYPSANRTFAFTHADETSNLVLTENGRKEIYEVIRQFNPDGFYRSIGNTRQNVIATNLKIHK